MKQPTELELAQVELESLIGAIGMQNEELGNMLFEAWMRVKRALMEEDDEYTAMGSR